MITVFLPCRAGSERVPFKNTKLFADQEGGLLYIKLKELLKVKDIKRIVLSTNDPKVIEIAKQFNSNKVYIDIRPEHLASSLTRTDELINYVPTIIKEEHILWTHVTSPFLSNDIYEKAIKSYFENLEKGYDSLMSVNKIQTFLWNEGKSLNYDRNEEKWPRTQTLPEIFEVNSGIFMNSYNNYLRYNDRIGKKPYMFISEGFASFDIDWEYDFKLGELIYKSLKL